MKSLLVTIISLLSITASAQTDDSVFVKIGNKAFYAGCTDDYRLQNQLNWTNGQEYGYLVLKQPSYYVMQCEVFLINEHHLSLLKSSIDPKTKIQKIVFGSDFDKKKVTLTVAFDKYDRTRTLRMIGDRDIIYDFFNRFWKIDKFYYEKTSIKRGMLFYKRIINHLMSYRIAGQGLAEVIFSYEDIVSNDK